MAQIWQLTLVSKQSKTINFKVKSFKSIIFPCSMAKNDFNLSTDEERDGSNEWIDEDEQIDGQTR